MIWEGRASARSASPPQAVWEVLLDGRRWSLWNPGVEWMWIEGEPLPGTLATIKLKRVRQTAFRIAEIVAPQRFTLQMTVGPVANLTLSWTLRALATGTQIDSSVAIGGFAAKLLERPARRVAGEMPASLERLAARAAELALP